MKNTTTTEYDDRIKAAVRKYLPGTDWRLLKAQFMAESELDPTVTSEAGAMGFAQIMPDTWDEQARRLNFPPDTSPFDADYSIIAGADYMRRRLLGWISPRPEMDRRLLAIAAYNVGFGHMLKAQKIAAKRAGEPVNDYARIIAALRHVPKVNADETTAYVKRTLRYYNLLLTEG